MDHGQCPLLSSSARRRLRYRKAAVKVGGDSETAQEIFGLNQRLDYLEWLMFFQHMVKPPHLVSSHGEHQPEMEPSPVLGDFLDPCSPDVAPPPKCNVSAEALSELQAQLDVMNHSLCEKLYSDKSLATNTLDAEEHVSTDAEADAYDTRNLDFMLQATRVSEDSTQVFEDAFIFSTSAKESEWKNSGNEFLIAMAPAVRNLGGLLCRLDEIDKMTTSEYNRWAYYGDGLEDEDFPDGILSGCDMSETEEDASKLFGAHASETNVADISSDAVSSIATSSRLDPPSCLTSGKLSMKAKQKARQKLKH